MPQQNTNQEIITITNISIQVKCMLAIQATLVILLHTHAFIRTPFYLSISCRIHPITSALIYLHAFLLLDIHFISFQLHLSFVVSNLL